MMKLIPAITAVGTLAAGAVLAAQATDTEGIFTHTPQEGTPVSVGTINGDIDVEEWDSCDLEVIYEIISDDPDEIAAIRVVEDTADGLHFTVVYPDNWTGSADAVVDFAVKLPSATDLDLQLRTINGDVDIAGGRGSTIIEIVNGDASAEGYEGLLSLNVVNGDIVFTNTPCLTQVNLVDGNIIGDLAHLECDAELASVDGTIVVTVSEDAQVNISTLSGSISIPAGEVRHELVGSTAEYGSGEYVVVIGTVSGDVEVLD